ncbi:glutamine-hydrolyzing carbamoyl-phosphate synthase small subunit [Desulfofalx alkaliphila]|uniref:glutamine-hydrolyzing carbamoyl-phosphate synthase small subunit n=1 Tax=Desulfofalx alkaliphila TaxID=105483 RepID=UPI0004E1A673|nr:glutamine-hydrolyzing carbamoyl-phosphate synthase small subunit [Desulfofalx alkaliphila]
MQALLVLEDGSVFKGRAFGATGESWGEIVFNTAMTGYQEILTDPSYCGQIVVMTYPLAGNSGFDKDSIEKKDSFVRGFVVREKCDQPSNWRSGGSLDEFLTRKEVVGISDLDTRALAKVIRDKGTMRAIISTVEGDPAVLLEKIKGLPDLTGQRFVEEVAAKEIYTVPGSGPRVAVIDFGSKQSIVQQLSKRACEVVVVPPTATAEDILGLNAAGIILSNGPGDPVNVPFAVETVKEVAGKLPIFGIGLGHQVLGLALGAKTYKLKFGHRGANHPVKDLESGRVFITSQNHGFVIDADSLPPEVTISHLNLNDNTVEGIKHKIFPISSVQYHPEGAPGPEDCIYLYDEFVKKCS